MLITSSGQTGMQTSHPLQFSVSTTIAPLTFAISYVFEMIFAGELSTKFMERWEAFL